MGVYLCYRRGQSRSNATSNYIECQYFRITRQDILSTYLGWITGFNTDGVFTMESCSPSFSPLNVTLIVTFVRQSRYHLALPSNGTTHYSISLQLEGYRLELLSSVHVLFFFLLSWVPNTKYYFVDVWTIGQVSWLVRILMEKAQLNSEDSECSGPAWTCSVKRSENRHFCPTFIRHRIWTALAPKVCTRMLMPGLGPIWLRPSPVHTSLSMSGRASNYCCCPRIDHLV